MSCIFSLFSSCCCCSTALILSVLLYLLYAVAKHYGYLPKKSVEGQHIFITGAGSGIGRQMALHFASLKAKVSVVDLNFAAAEKVASEIKSKGQQALALQCDVCDIEGVKSTGNKARSEFGDVNILINNAGIVSGKKILEVSEALIKKTIDVNTTSHAWTVREFLPAMMNKNKGHIVTIASAAGTMGVCGLSDYCASKFGAFGFNESLRMELKQQKSSVKTTVICPFYINTGMFEGVKTRFPFLLPILEEKWAADRIVNAVLQNEDVVLMPWFTNLTFVMRGILPVWVFDWMADFLGANSSMEEFKGRGGH